jgi:hypothetical protein
MQRALQAFAFAVLVCGSALAEDKPDAAAKVQVGTTVICDTQRQMERFVALFDGDYADAMNKVNAEERNPTACIGATMAYMRGDELTKAKSSSKGTYQIIRVLVVGINTPHGFQAVQPAPFFSIEKSEEIEI